MDLVTMVQMNDSSRAEATKNSEEKKNSATHTNTGTTDSVCATIILMHNPVAMAKCAKRDNASLFDNRKRA